ncbi:MAG TPA: hypothetical protein VHG10_10715, partial [Glycomyces sp.]|nr:hypothetical protein [Glycomyces sp.]
QGEYRYIEPIGDRLMVEYYEGDEARTQIYDKGFDKVGNSLSETFDAIDGGSALAWPGDSGFSTTVGNVIGLGRDSTRTTIHTGFEVYDCDASDTRLACFTLEGMQIYSFRDA